jgi:hypothetical protein
MPDFTECSKSELDLFEPRFVQTAVDESHVTELSSVGAITHGSTIEFVVPGSEDYVDLSDTYIVVQCKIAKSDGSNIAAATNVGPINYLGATMWSRVDVQLGDCCVTRPHNFYAYQSYITNLLTYGQDSKNTALQMSMWHKDKGTLDTADNTKNAGLATRTTLFAESAVVEICTRVHANVCDQPKCIPSNLDVRFRFTPNNDAFVLMACGTKSENNDTVPDDTAALADKAQLVIVKANLYVKKQRVSPSLRLAHEMVMRQHKHPALIHVRTMDVKMVTVQQGQPVLLSDNLNLGQLPLRIVVCMVDDRALNGSYLYNPLAFKHNNVNYLALNVDGRIVPTKPFQPTFHTKGGGLYTRDYLSMFAHCGMTLCDHGNDISYDDYSKGYAIWVFDVTRDASAFSSHSSTTQSGTVRLDLKFAKALDKAVDVIVLGEFEETIEIDANRNVSTACGQVR